MIASRGFPLQDALQSVRVGVPGGAGPGPGGSVAPAGQGGQEVRREAQRYEKGRPRRPGRRQHQSDSSEQSFLDWLGVVLNLRKVLSGRRVSRISYVSLERGAGERESGGVLRNISLT